MREFYNSGAYGLEIDSIEQASGSTNFRHEFVPVSLVIRNFVTGRDELLAKTIAGYDQETQAKSLNRFLATLNALKQWEE